MKCRICGNATTFLFSGIIMEQYSVHYHRCDVCGYMQMEELAHLEEAYAVAPIHISDVGLLARNLRFAEQLAPFFYFSGMAHERFRDFGGGYGVFSRLMRDIGFDFFLCDPYVKNLFAAGFESSAYEHYTATTALEVFEHLKQPAEMLDELLRDTESIAIGTNLTDGYTGNLQAWHYLGSCHGQHIGFFSTKTMLHLAKRFHLHYAGDGRSLTVLSKKTIAWFPKKTLAFRHRYSVILLEYVKLRMTSRIEADFRAARGNKNN